ncbi:MAG: DUF5069 domain-containing protein [Candidatus Eremiobacteraeota bacterium]|nr:DUF5069 domain-containing protein [Candidatus Eremiobacteraeota bacterium]
MEPLDLTRHPPRPPRATMLGAKFLPRTIDKLRAELPGGKMGGYLNEDRGISAFVVRRLGLNMDELRDEVARAESEAEIEAWLRGRLEPAKIEETNKKLESFTIERMQPDDLAMMRDRHAIMADRPELVKFLDVLEADDEAFEAAPHEF